ncbi:hypothetical protein BHOIPH791_10080 [Bartonella henselae]|nr:hypothetical protein BH623125_12980 [Bartonella henselae]GFF03647.1 hypothetical protein BH80429_04680 [Bartonella henselae]
MAGFWQKQRTVWQITGSCPKSRYCFGFFGRDPALLPRPAANMTAAIEMVGFPYVLLSCLSHDLS